MPLICSLMHDIAGHGDAIRRNEIPSEAPIIDWILSISTP
jgi:hypothetical protein